MFVKAYLQSGKKDKVMGNLFYSYLDELKSNHTAILTPSEADKGRVYKPRKNTSPAPSPTPEKIEPPKYIEVIPLQYGVKIQNSIKLYSSKDACAAYIECYKEFNDSSDIELVEIKVIG